MTLGILGTKVGMTQVFDEQGKAFPVTVLQLGPCPVLQVRNKDLDGYHAVQIGYGNKSRKRASRAERGHVSTDLESKRRKALSAAGKTLSPKANCEPQRFVREFRLDKPLPEIGVGKLLNVGDVFPELTSPDGVTKYRSRVDVIGTSKGRGTAGAMKRHNFHGLPASHGVKKHHRSPGSVGSHASNRGSGRPKLGHKGPGRYGATRVTARNLFIVKLDVDNHLLLVEGAVPGPNGGYVTVQPTTKKSPPPMKKVDDGKKKKK